MKKWIRKHAQKSSQNISRLKHNMQGIFAARRQHGQLIKIPTSKNNRFRENLH
jgi:hypothetical protein